MPWGLENAISKIHKVWNYICPSVLIEISKMDSHNWTKDQSWLSAHLYDFINTPEVPKRYHLYWTLWMSIDNLGSMRRILELTNIRYQWCKVIGSRFAQSFFYCGWLSIKCPYSKESRCHLETSMLLFDELLNDILLQGLCPIRVPLIKLCCHGFHLVCHPN